MTGKPDRRHCEKLNDRRLTQLQRQISGGGICSDLIVFHPLSSTNQSEVWGGIISPCPRSCTASEIFQCASGAKLILHTQPHARTTPQMVVRLTFLSVDRPRRAKNLPFCLRMSDRPTQERTAGLAVVPQCNIPRTPRRSCTRPEVSPCIFLKRDLAPWPRPVWRARPFPSRRVLPWPPSRPPF
jgi:hypothetical protein